MSETGQAPSPVHGKDTEEDRGSRDYPPLIVLGVVLITFYINIDVHLAWNLP